MQNLLSASGGTGIESRVCLLSKNLYKGCFRPRQTPRNRTKKDNVPWCPGHFIRQIHSVGPRNSTMQVLTLGRHARRAGFLSQWNFIQREFHALSKSLGVNGSLKLSDGQIRLFSLSANRMQEDNDGNKRREEEERRFRALVILTSFITLFTFLAVMRNDMASTHEQSASLTNNPGYISWYTFLEEVLKRGEAAEILVYKTSTEEYARIRLHPGARIPNVPHVPFLYMTASSDLEDKIRKEEEKMGVKPGTGVPISYHHVRGSNQLLFYFLVLTGLMIPWFLLMRRSASNIKNISKNSQFSNQDIFGKKANFLRLDKDTQSGKGIRFKDVAGLKEAKQEIIEFVDYLKNPDAIKKLGGKIPCGALLLGPPGCGKTLLAKAVATEAGVPFLATAGSEFVEIVGGLGASRIRNMFKEAKKQVPCIIYIDEIDALGRKRQSSEFSGEEDHTLNQLLVEMDGMSSIEGIIVMGATNRPEHLDKALLRPGRFDRHIFIDLPTMEERRELFHMYLSKLTLNLSPDDVAPRLSQLTPGMSGADINNVCNEAGLIAARNAKTAVDQSDLDKAVERVLAGAAKKTKILGPWEKKVNAYYEAGRTLTAWLSKTTNVVLKVSIIPRTSLQLGFAQFLPKDQYLHTTEELFERLCVNLAGSVSEAMIFNHTSSAAVEDLKKIKDMAYKQVRLFGMNERVGQLSFPISEQDEHAAKPYSQYLASVIDEEARRLVAEANISTKQLLTDNIDKLHLLADALLEKETLTYEEIEQLIGPPAYADRKKMPAKD